MPSASSNAPASTSAGHHQREKELMTKLQTVPYDGLQGVAPRGVPVFSNGDDEYFSRRSAIAASIRPPGSTITQTTIDASKEAAACMRELTCPIVEEAVAVCCSSPTVASTAPPGCVLHTCCSPGEIIGGGASSLLQYPGIDHPIDEELLSVTGIKWQCVEFGRRWWLSVHGVWLRSIPTAEQIWTSIKKGTDVYTGNPKVSMIKIDNGVTFRLNCESEMMVPDGVASNLAPRAGDLIIWRRAHDIPFGHVAAIVEVGPDYVKIAEQNTDFDDFLSRENYSRQDDLVVQFVKNREYGLKASQKHAPTRASTNTSSSSSSSYSDLPDSSSGEEPCAAESSDRHYQHGPYSATRQHTRIFPLRTTIRRMKPQEKSAHRRGTDGRTQHTRVHESNNNATASNDSNAVTVTYEIIDEDVILGWIRCDRPLVDFSKEDTPDMFRAVLSRGGVTRVPFPVIFDGEKGTPIGFSEGGGNAVAALQHSILTETLKASSQLPPSATRRPLHLPWLDIKDNRTDFFLKRSLTVNGDLGPNARAAHNAVPDGYYKMDYDFFMRIRNAAQSLHRLAMDATWKVVHASNRSDILMKFFNIPIDLHAHLTESLMREPPACGRFDFGYDGKNIIMFEYNCDSSAALLEASETQEKMMKQYGLIENATQPTITMPSKICCLENMESKSAAVAADEADDVMLELDIQAPQSILPKSVESTGSYLSSKMVAYFKSLHKLLEEQDIAKNISSPPTTTAAVVADPKKSVAAPAKKGALSGILEGLKATSISHNAAPTSASPARPTPPKTKPTPQPRVMHFMVDDDDEEKYTVLKAMDAAQAAGFQCKMCVKLSSFTFSKPFVRQAGKVMSPEETEAATNNALKAERLAVSQSPFKHLIYDHDTTSLGPCPRRVYDLDGVEVKVVWKTWSWDTVLKDHRLAVEAKVSVEVPPRDPHTDIISAAVENAKTIRPRLSDVLLNKNIRVFEPFWKAVAGSKALLPTMYALDPTHENMCAAAFEQTEFIKSRPYLSKPVSGRAGQNIVFMQQDDAAVQTFDCSTTTGRRNTCAERKRILHLASENPLRCPEFDRHDVSAEDADDGRWGIRREQANLLTRQASWGSPGVQTPLETSDGKFHDTVQVYQHRLRLRSFEAEPFPDQAASEEDTIDDAKHHDPAVPMQVYPIFCAWMVDDQFGAVCVREDTSRITKLASMVVPCVVERK